MNESILRLPPSSCSLNLHPSFCGLAPPPLSHDSLPFTHTISSTSLPETHETTTFISRLSQNCILKTQFKFHGDVHKLTLLARSVTKNSDKIVALFYLN